MKKYSFKCTCGHVVTVDANTREEAVEKMKAMMDQNGVDQHWAQNHQNDTMPKPTVEQTHMMIEQNLVEAETGEAAPPTSGDSTPPPPPPAPPAGAGGMPPMGSPSGGTPPSTPPQVGTV